MAVEQSLHSTEKQAENNKNPSDFRFRNSPPPLDQNPDAVRARVFGEKVLRGEFQKGNAGKAMKSHCISVPFAPKEVARSFHPAGYYSRLMTELGRAGNVDEVLRLFSEMIKSGFEPNVFCYNTLLNSLVIANRDKEAWEVFEKMSECRNVSTFNIMVKVMVKGCSWYLGQFDFACEILREMSKNGCTPDVTTYSTLITALCRARRIEDAYNVLERMVDANCSPNLFSYTPILHGLCSKGRIEEAKRLFELMEKCSCSPNVLCYNTLLNSLVIANRVEEARDVFKMMKNVCPNVSTFNIMVKGYSWYSGQFDLAYKILDEMKKKGCTPDVTTYSTLITGLCRAGRIEDAYDVLNRRMVEAMCSPNVITYTPILQGLCAKGRIEDANRLIESMEKRGCSPNTVVYNILIEALCKMNDFDGVKMILDESVLKGWKPNALTYNIYINALCKAGKVKEAYRVLEKSFELDWHVSVFSYNAVMSCFCRIGGWLTVLKLLTHMLKKGIVPNTRTYNIVIHSLCKARKVDLAKCMMGCEGDDVLTYNMASHGFHLMGVAAGVGRVRLPLKCSRTPL